MRADSKPLLAPHAHTSAGPDQFSVKGVEVSVDYVGNGARHVERVISSLDGRRSAAEIASHHGIGLEELRALLAHLHDEGLLLDTAIAAHDYDSVASFLEALRLERRFWGRHIFAQQFWMDLRSGAAPLSTVLGWGVEFYHYVAHADEYMAAGVAYCSDTWVTRQWVAQHFVEEAGHGEIFLEGLAGCGLSRSRIREAPPLPATRALMNALTESAMEGPLAYTACFALTQPESTAPSLAEQESFYGELSRCYPGAASLFRAFLRHARIDSELHHERTILEKILEARGEVDRSSREAIIRSIRRLAEYFVMFFEQISEYYASPHHQFPRRAPTMMELLRT
ncbi:iron-containing redox enzyme family protein [Sorangium sp. So ce134]